MINVCVHNETGFLRTVILGVANDFGGTPNISECYDPKSKEHVLAGTFPKQEDVINEIGYFEKILTGYGVDVIRPLNIKGVNQIFARDIAFVIGDKIVIPNIIKERKKEIEMLEDVLLDIDPNSIIRMPLGVNVEGGDVILSNDYIFVGYSNESEFNRYTVARTNKQGLNFLENMFPNKKVKGFELIKSDKDARENALHLDCCFQPIGNRMAILYRNGFKNQSDIVFLVNYFGEENIIDISKQEMYDMCSNVFSISDNVIVSEKKFTRLNRLLRSKGFIVEEIAYSEIAKMEGLLRCSTLPLIRE